MAAVRNTPALRAFWRIHRFLLNASDGRFFTRMGPGRQLLLITKGRKTGEPRPVGLTYIEYPAGRYIVVASYLGEDRHPGWWLNLLANPSAEVKVGGETTPVTAQALEEPERSEVFSQFVAEGGDEYLEYQRRTDRRLPVVALTPR
jgi:deazaflavin-dependent oxidoreductase (nitroreductase family)